MMRNDDQVTRRHRFQAEHPEVNIKHSNYPYWHWIATWREDTGERTITELELGTLLDHLEEVLAA
jgi:hypothetical protein